DRDRGVIQQIAFPYTSRSCSDTLRAQVQAASYVPRVKLDPTDIDLGVVLDCAASVDTVIDVVNTSLVSVTVTGVVGSGITYSGGSVVIEPKSSKQLRITIAPSGVSGPFSLSARVLYGPCGASDSVTLTGTLLRPQYTSTLPVVDFGTILLCDSSRSVSRSIAVAARGLLGLRSRIQSVDLGAPFTTDIVAGSSFGDTVAFAINFTPAAIGQFTDTLRLALGPCSTLVDVIVTGSCATKSSTVTATATYYGILPPGQFRDEQITITNSGSAPIVVLGMSGVPAPFSILSSTCVLPVTLQPGGKASITVRYTFQGYARKDTIAVRVYTGAPCADTTQLQLIGWTTPKDTLRGLEIIAPQEVVVRAGDDADIPLQLASPQPLDSAGIYSMTIKMSYDPQLFKLVSVPQSPSSSQISANETAPGNVTIQISSSNPLLASNPLLTLRGSTYVGPTRSTPIVIDTAYASGVMISGRNGKLTVVPDCDIDATTAGIGRPIILRLATERNDLLHITYSTLTDEQTTLCIVDLSGRTLAIDLPSVRPGLHEVHVPVGHFESGAYSVVFRNGRHMRTSTFIISR
ncbi:MAG: choice-of-anchor D domain-containing protein, partial [Ignavibacteria bacterium]